MAQLRAMDPIRFAVQAPADDLSGLVRTLSLLKGINAYLVSINTGFAGLRQVSLPERSVESFAEQIKQLADKLTPTAFVRGTKATALVDQILGPEARVAFERQIESFRKRFKDAFRGESFSDPGSAAKVARTLNEQVRTEQFRDARRLRQMLSDAGQAGVNSPPRLVPSGAGGPVSATIGDGSIGFSVGADRLTVVLGPGPIPLTIPVDRIQATVGPGVVAANMDQLRAAVGAPGGPGGGTRGGSGTKTVPLDRAGLVMGNEPTEDPAELQRRIRRTAKSAKTSITRSVDQWTKITETFDEQGELLVSDEVRNRAKGAADRIRRGVAAAQEAAARDESSATGLSPVQQLQYRAEILRQQGQRISQAVEAEAQILEQTGQTTMLARTRAQVHRDITAANRLDQRAVTMEQAQRRAATRETLAAVGRGVRDEAAQQRRQEAEDRAMVRESTRTRRARSRIEAATARAQEEAEKKAREAFGKEQSAAASALSAQAGRARVNELLSPSSGYIRDRRSESASFARSRGFAGTETFVFRRDDGGTRYFETIKLARRNNEDFAASVERTERALRATRKEAGAAGRNFLQNTQQVTSWAASVGALYGAIGLLRSGLNSFIEQSYQIQRLGVVFGGVGGSAQQLANDVSQLAVVNGRSTEEALQSAIAWSRLGLTRRQVAEAVRVSLVAANVAEIDAAAATESLQGVYQSYRMEVGKLAGTLAQLNEVSNTTNATVGELFDGLSRVAPAAAQAGVPIRTLIGYLGQMIAQTKQSGANIGNALKTFVGRLSTPEMLRQIRDDFGVQISDESGAQKEFLGILDAVYVRYQQLTDAEQSALLVRVAGNTQLNRLSALMDGYIRAQVLAINTQLRLNSAEAENEKIRATLKNRLQGLVSEMQRFAQIQGSNGPGQALGAVAESLQNVLRVLNLPGVNVAFTGLIGLLGVLGARALITKARLDAAAGTPGFLARSWNAAADAVKKLGAEWGKAWQAAGGLGTVPRRLRLAGQAAPSPAPSPAGNAGMLATAGATSLRAMATLQQAMTAFFRLFGRYLGWIGAIVAATAAFNKGMEAVGQSSASADKEITSLTQALEGADAKANATADSIRLLDTVLRLLPNASAEARTQILKDLGDLPVGIGLTAAEISQGMADPLAAVGGVQAARERAFTAQVAAQQESFVRAQEVVRRIQREITRLESSWWPDRDLIGQKNTELAQARGRSIQQRVRVRETIESDAGDGDTGEEARRKYGEIIDARAAVIRSIFNDGSVDGPAQRLRAQIEAEKAVLAGLQGSQQRDQGGRTEEFQRSARMREESERLWNQARKLREAAAAEEDRPFAEKLRRGAINSTIGLPLVAPIGLASSVAELARKRSMEDGLREASRLEQQAAGLQAREQSPEMRQIDARLEVTSTKIRETEAKLRQLESTADLTAVQDTLEKSRRRGAQSLVPFAYGRSETESIQRQLAAAEKMLRESGKGMAPHEELGRREALLAETGRLREEQNRRDVEVQREINALIEQRTREFERQVALASPAELLRTLAAIQTTQQGLTAGRFLASGDLRGRIMDLPGFGDQERSLAREAGLIASMRNRGNSRDVSADLAQVQSLIGRTLAKVGSGSEGAGVSPEISVATKELGVFAGAVTTGTKAMGGLTAAMAKLEAMVISINTKLGQAATSPIRNPQAGGMAGGFAL